MPNKTPGQCCYEAYWHTHYALRNPTHRNVLIGWKQVMPQPCQWCREAAAQAVLAWEHTNKETSGGESSE